nr:MAG TPA: hypothetical protein [Caudoviricetes sp.]
MPNNGQVFNKYHALMCQNLMVNKKAGSPRPFV